MSSSVAQPVPVSIKWLRRLRFALATAAVWILLHYAGGLLLPRGLDRPLALVGSPHGPLAGIAVVLVIWIGAAAATFLLAGRDGRQTLMVIGLALALWAAEGGQQRGTMDAWLLLQNETRGPPTRAPYWRLLVDCLYLAVAVPGVAAIAALLAPAAAAAGGTQGAGPAAAPGAAARVAGVFRLPAGERARGVLALVLTAAVAAVAMYILTGPLESQTLRGRVYFGVAAGFAAGSLAAVRLLKVRTMIWYWPAPLLLAVVGLVAAGIDPALALPEQYKLLDTIPAWPAVRALPVEMVGVGLLGVLAVLRPPDGRGPSAGAS